MSLSIQNILEAYKARLRAPQGSILREVVRAYGIAGIETEMKDFNYSPATKIVAIKISGPKKSEMLMRKEQVLKEMRTTLREADAPTDII